MRKTYRTLNIALIFTLASIIFQDIAYSETFLLRPALKFNNSTSLYNIYYEIKEEIENHLDRLKKRYKNGEMPDYLSLPEVNFSNKEEAGYEYDREKNKIVFYTSGDLNEKDFREICWLAYGDWFSQNEAAQYNNSERYAELVWKSLYVNYYIKENGYVEHQEVRDKTILDVGTGPGIPGILIAENGAREVTCVDVSAVQLESARKEAEKRGLGNIIFKEASVYRLPFDDNSFDMVFFNLMLERQPEGLRRIALKEIFRVLRPGGEIKFLEAHVIGHPGLGIEALGWDEEEWSRELKEAGFEELKVLQRKKSYYNNIGTPIMRDVVYTMKGSKPNQVITNIIDDTNKQDFITEKWEIIDDIFGRLMCRLSLSSKEGRIGHTYINIEKAGIVMGLCEGIYVSEEKRKRGYGTMLTLKAFHYALEEARHRGLDPKWALINWSFGTSDDDEEARRVFKIVHNLFERKLGFKNPHDIKDINEGERSLLWELIPEDQPYYSYYKATSLKELMSIYDKFYKKDIKGLSGKDLKASYHLKTSL